ncbi:MAG: replicative DNA helicase [Proteobacteria bacterium]|nr:replicative DNA helicase [Pseudomonadota bacterium]
MTAQVLAPPHSLDAEKAVLGAVLRDADAFNLIADKLKAEQFYLDAHRDIFQAMCELYQLNEPTDILTVAEKLRRQHADNDFLGPAYLVELTENSPFTQNIEYYARVVSEYYFLRRIINACQSTVKKAMSYDGEVAGFIEDIEKEFIAIANQQDSGGIATTHEVLDKTIAEIEARLNSDGAMTGVPSQFSDLDRNTGGWQRSDLVIIAARPGMGKTAFALNCVVNSVKAGKHTVIFTLEMSKTQLMERIISSEARIDSSKMRKGDLNEEEQDRLMHGIRGIGTMPAMLGIDETPSISLLELRSRCRRFKKEYGLDLIVIDYLQLMGPSGTKKYESREREISEISGGLKALAKELNVPVIALAQLNRGVEGRPDKVPKLSDLRESGSMEQDADMILFIYRDEYYNPNSEDAGKAMLRIAKNRHGSLQDIYLAFAPNFLKFTNLQQS